ncbi:MAG: Recombination protein recR [Candidatus Berkelbacteria bacterium Licking1014_7]|uniref:Recombination protein RecR n=1 Tax=Candidatus Berkelbacteria bacterium Licking1014_7 TaxID=2017147 RepID=A0A554LHW8_9BACT|nr:MAG: Recombination protein recR [Candidatus Berkelbacteria bacterium Licking1014_7]
MLPESVNNLISEFSKLPGIGPKSASRLVFYLLSKSVDDVADLGRAVLDLKKNLRFCDECFNISEEKKCKICQSARRDRTKIMVVSAPLDIVAMEKTEYNGLYFVLGGVISPIDGVGPENLRIDQLLERIKEDTDMKELILATNPSLEGEATAMYIAKSISNLKSPRKLPPDGGAIRGRQISKLPKITRIARGLPVGGDLEYADEETLSQAVDGRKEY